MERNYTKLLPKSCELMPRQMQAMLMSAAVELKFHFWPKVHEDITYKPSVSSRITSASWSKDNSYLTYLSEKSKPEIISLKDSNNIKLVHTVATINDVSSVIFQKTTKKCLAIGTQNGQVAMYDTKSKTINKLFENVPSVSSTQHPLSAVDVSLDGTTVAIGSQEGIIYLYDMRNFLQPVMVWKAHNSKINKLLFQYPVKEVNGHPLDISASDMVTKSLSDAQQIRLRLTDHDDKDTATDSSSKISISTKKSLDKGSEITDNEFLKKT
ncbi:protein nedd1 [Holotrichia oblita]|uniref:Protein nedd1 n=1 Tax=Holotrichia oblita TaxID=644536 RepID=A0ACB9TM84_HOLOL|nr:protein nedd1 [Holotrichia oblita]